MRSTSSGMAKNLKLNLCEEIDVPDQHVDFKSFKDKKRLPEVLSEYNATNPCVIINCIFDYYLGKLREGNAKPPAFRESTPVKENVVVETPQTLKTQEEPQQLDLPELKEHDSIDDAPKSVSRVNEDSIEPPAKVVIKEEESYKNFAEVFGEVGPIETREKDEQLITKLVSRNNSERVAHNEALRFALGNEAFTYNTRDFANEPVIRQTAITKEEALKAREICAYLRCYKHTCATSEKQCLSVLDSLRILSDHVGIESQSIPDLVEELLSYFSSVFGPEVFACDSVEDGQLREACLDYVRLGYVTLHYECAAAIK